MVGFFSLVHYHLLFKSIINLSQYVVAQDIRIKFNNIVDSEQFKLKVISLATAQSLTAIICALASSKLIELAPGGNLVYKPDLEHKVCHNY